jgi:NDP-hexose C3-ketoreductase / dTDP-4-oxo-2-deoxy-alpha-D-pentos-2-ene 2,3-reductase
LEVLPACAEYGVGLIAWSPLASGLLAGPSDEAGGRRGSKPTRAKADLHSDQLARYFAICANLGEAPSVIALAWLLHQKGVVSTIIGPASLEQLSSVMHVPSISLSPEVLQQIDAIFPPCGPAPEAYAW